jgi:LmbE family N-acetylglucosaminyl deacetylase
MIRRWAAAVVVTAAASAHAQDRGAAALGPLVAGLGTSARVLVVGAHPDDEDAPLIALLSRGRHARTAYLSLTRGEGGANLVGAESGVALGVLRTAESLAARQVDGAEQYFTRALDFGLSKTAEETAAHWASQEGGDAVLGDVVSVVRTFRPHVVVSVYEGSPRDGHGQHQMAGRLTREAFDAAADTARFPAAKFGRPWAPASLYRVLRADEPDTGARVVRLNVGEYAPLAGRTFAEVASEAQARQRSQGAPPPAALGSSWTRLRLVATRVGAAPGDEARGDRSLFDGVDTTLARVRRPGLVAPLAAAVDSIAPAIASVRAAYRPDDPAGAVAPLAALVRVAAKAAALAGSTTVQGSAYDPDVARSLEDAWRRAREALVLASGVAVEATADREIVARATPTDSSDTIAVHVAVYDRGRAPVRVELVTLTSATRGHMVRDGDVAPDSVWRVTIVATPRYVSQPWWLVGGLFGALYAADVDGRSEREWEESSGSALRVAVRLRIAGADALVTVPVVYRAPEPSRVAERPVAVVPGITLRLDHSAEYARAGVPLARPMRVTVQSAYAAPRDVRVTLALPPGLTTDSATRRLTLPAGATAVIAYVVRGVPKAAEYKIAALAAVAADSFAHGMGTIGYDHVPARRVYFPTATTMRGVDVALPPGAYVGYVAGPNDGIPLMLQELGLPVTLVDPNGLALPSADLSRFSAVVVGPRAYDTNPVLVSANEKLLAYARAGGTVVVLGGQYAMEQPGVLPYPIALGRPAQAVTQEESPVRLADPAARMLTAPNAIAADRDFADWIQERASFVPSSFDPHWRAPLELADAGEPPTRGALLVASYGRGTYVYTTLAFQRQLTAANPGAARLFVNLLAARPHGVNWGQTPSRLNGVRLH